MAFDIDFLYWLKNYQQCFQLKIMPQRKSETKLLTNSSDSF